MIGRFCTVSTGGNQNVLSTEGSKEMKASLSDYAWPECGAQRYHLVFRVEALSHRVTLSIACDACSVREQLVEDTYDHEDQYASGMVTDNNGNPPQS